MEVRLKKLGVFNANNGGVAMGKIDEKLQIKKDVNIQELVALTKDFIKLADSLYESGKLTNEEYNELTFLKKDFLGRVSREEVK